MSPERLAGERATELSDVYALGVVAYEMLSGEHPTGEKSHGQIIAAQIAGELRPLSAAVPNAPPALASVIERCLARVPRQRPRAREVAAMLAATA
jgi:serine/threonine-protein kinase